MYVKATDIKIWLDIREAQQILGTILTVLDHDLATEDAVEELQEMAIDIGEAIGIEISFGDECEDCDGSCEECEE